MLRNSLRAFAKARGISDGKITFDQFIDYRVWFLGFVNSKDPPSKDAPFPIKSAVETRAILYAKARSALDARQQKIWDDLIGAPATIEFPELTLHRKLPG